MSMPIGFEIVAVVENKTVTVVEDCPYTDILMPRTGEFLKIFLDEFWTHWHVKQVVHRFPEGEPGITHTLVVMAIGEETEAWLKDQSVKHITEYYEGRQSG